MLTEHCSSATCGVFLAILGAMHPWAAIGAAGGCCFFMAFPPSRTTYLQRLSLGAFSWIVGYAHGVFWYPDGPPYNPSAMLPSVALSAVGVVIGVAAVRMFKQGGPLPAWLEGILDRVPGLKRKGGDNGL